MLQTGESENEILLGNKQLLAIFFVVVLLLGVAFAGGYKLGQASKKSGTVTAASESTQTDGGQTHDVTPNQSPEASQPAPADTSTQSNSSADTPATQPETAPKEQAPLGSPKTAGKNAQSGEDAEAAAPPPTKAETRGEFIPQPGQLFLQVAAVGRDEAEAVADVLHKKGFRAHAVPKPGNPKIYRVLIGPLTDAADLNATRDALRKNAGFREVITQRY